MYSVSRPRPSPEGIGDRIRLLMGQLDSLLEGAQASAHLVACGQAAIEPLRTYLLEGQVRSVPESRIWAVRALGGLAADEVLLEYLRRPTPTSDAVLRFAEETVRNVAAQALANSYIEGVEEVLFELARAERLPSALGAIVVRNAVRAMPILIRALEDDFARDAAMEALHRSGELAREPLVCSALDPGNGCEASLRRRRASLELLGEVEIDRAAWNRLQPLLDERDPALVCATAEIGASTWADPELVTRRLLAILPDVGWEWSSTAEDLIVESAHRVDERRHVLLALPPEWQVRPDLILTWRRIYRRIAAGRERARDCDL